MISQAQRSINLDLAFLNQPLSFHSHLYDTLLSYHPWFQRLLPDFKDLSFRHRPFLQHQVFPNHKPFLNLSPLPASNPPFLPKQPVPFGPVPNRRTSEGGSVLYLQIFRLPVVTVQAGPVRRTQRHPLQFLGHTQQTLEKLSTFRVHLALLVLAAPVQTYRRGGSRGDSRKADSQAGDPRRGRDSMRVVRQVDLTSAHFQSEVVESYGYATLWYAYGTDWRCNDATDSNPCDYTATE